MQKFLDKDGLKRVWDNTTTYIDKKCSLITDDTLTLADNVLSVTIPAKGVTKEEFAAMTDAEKNGLVIVTDEDAPGGSGGNSGSAGGEVYSTEEVRIGTWIDGKPLYKRTWARNGKTGDKYGIVFADFDIEQVCNAYGYVLQTVPTGTSGVIQLFMNSKNFESTELGPYFTGYSRRYSSVPEFYCKWHGLNGNSIDATVSAVITLEYTKTTDEGGTT